MYCCELIDSFKITFAIITETTGVKEEINAIWVTGTSWTAWENKLTPKKVVMARKKSIINSDFFNGVLSSFLISVGINRIPDIVRTVASKRKENEFAPIVWTGILNRAKVEPHIIAANSA